MKLLVVGPVLSQARLVSRSPHEGEVTECYERLALWASKKRNIVVLPVLQKPLNDMEPHRFVEAMIARIDMADGVVTVLGPNDQSGAVESAIAAMRGKLQLLITVGKHKPSRMIAGLPNVVGVTRGLHSMRPIDHLCNAIDASRESPLER